MEIDDDADEGMASDVATPTASVPLVCNWEEFTADLNFVKPLSGHIRFRVVERLVATWIFMSGMCALSPNALIAAARASEAQLLSLASASISTDASMSISSSGATPSTALGLESGSESEAMRSVSRTSRGAKVTQLRMRRTVRWLIKWNRWITALQRCIEGNQVACVFITVGGNVSRPKRAMFIDFSQLGPAVLFGSKFSPTFLPPEIYTARLPDDLHAALERKVARTLLVDAACLGLHEPLPSSSRMNAILAIPEVQ